MRCPALSELPPPPAGKKGWPWTEESVRLSNEQPEPAFWPRVTIVTPSFNQGVFLEETIRSILLQGYPDLEYFVLDGGSTDNSVEIIRKYSQWISFWVSEADAGQSAAINRGLRMGSGVYATWINSDDMLCKDALLTHFLQGFSAPDLVYVGDCIYVDELGNVRFHHRGRVHCLQDLVRVATVWRTGGCIDQPAVLFPLQLALRVGGLNEKNHYTMDYELWGQFFLGGAEVHYTGIPFGIFRSHSAQKTQESLKQTESTLDTALTLIDLTDSLSTETKQEILAELQAYRIAYPNKLWKSTGRLARMGLPPVIVKPARDLKAAVDKIIGNFTLSESRCRERTK
jgi:glycosyltransferase involved in cell wall biosynthesis